MELRVKTIRICLFQHAGNGFFFSGRTRRKYYHDKFKTTVNEITTTFNFSFFSYVGNENKMKKKTEE